MREQAQIRGLTTAATVWATASVGLAIAFGMYILGTLATLIVFGLLALTSVPTYVQMKKKLAAQAWNDAADGARTERPKDDV